jgi:hypothetical protein
MGNHLKSTTTEDSMHRTVTRWAQDGGILIMNPAFVLSASKHYSHPLYPAKSKMLYFVTITDQKRK